MEIEKPDYDEWLKYDALDRDEIGLLMVGIEPNSELGKEMASTYEGEGHEKFIERFGEDENIMGIHSEYLAIDKIVLRSIERGRLQKFAVSNDGYVPTWEIIKFANDIEISCADFQEAVAARAQKELDRRGSARKNKLDSKNLGDKEKENLLRTIGALSLILVSRSGEKFGNKDNPNIAQLAKELIRFVETDLDESIVGLAKSTLQERIKNGINLIH